MSFRVGDRVRIARGSDYYSGESGSEQRANPSSNIFGTVLDNYINVMWDNGIRNSYGTDDLELALETPEDIAAKEEQDRIKAEKAINSRSIIERIASEVFDNYDIIITNTSNANYSYSLVVKFDEVEVSNSHGANHKIKDFYLIFHFKNNGTLYCKPCGWKQTYSYSEWSSSYTHSHISGRPDDLFSTFCLGSTPVAVMVEECKEEFDEDNLELLFYTMKEFIKWESLEGGPYRKIRDIQANSGRGRRISCNDDDVELTFRALKEQHHEFPILFKEDKYANKLEVNKESQEFIGLVTSVATLKVRFNDSTKEHILITSTNPQAEVDRINRALEDYYPMFTFKGEPIKQILYNGVISEDPNNNLPLVAHPDLVARVANELEIELNNFILNEQYN